MAIDIKLLEKARKAKRQGRAYGDDVVNKFLKMYAEGLTVQQIATELRVHVMTVYNWIQKYIKSEAAIVMRKSDAGEL